MDFAEIWVFVVQSWAAQIRTEVSSFLRNVLQWRRARCLPIYILVPLQRQYWHGRQGGTFHSQFLKFWNVYFATLMFDSFEFWQMFGNTFNFAHWIDQEHITVCVSKGEDAEIKKIYFAAHTSREGFRSCQFCWLTIRTKYYSIFRLSSATCISLRISKFLAQVLFSEVWMLRSLRKLSNLSPDVVF